MTQKLSAFIFVIAIASVIGTAVNGQGNSTRKIRTQPNAISSKAGSAVNWANGWDQAIERSRQTGKPIFWYVPTLRGTFMDRKTEIDQYMMSGPFSWPATIELLNQNFIPIKAQPTKDQQKKFELSRYKFVEPGFLILDDEKTVAKIDQLSTFHADWWQHVLRHFGAKLPEPNEQISRLLAAFADTGNIDQFSEAPNDEHVDAHRLLLLGMSQFQNGQHKQADQTWQSLVEKHSNHPLAWKASCEIQRIGPFARGFEVFNQIPSQSLEAGLISRGTRAPKGTFQQSELWSRSTRFLLNMQSESGGFFDSDYDFGGTDSLPNVHVAVTSLSGMALIEASSRLPVSNKKAIADAVERVFKFVTNEANINRIDRDEIIWADAYRLRFLCQYQKFTGRSVAKEIAAATKSLENIQSKRGGWYHEYENAFVTATALCALYESGRAGGNLDQTKIEKGVNSLKNERYANGTYPYSTGRARRGAVDLERLVPGSAGRMPMCELALSRWGQSDQKRLTEAVQKSFEHHDKLDVALKYDNHTSTYAYGGFFFWYDMRSRCEAILAIQDQDQRKEFLTKQLQLVMSLPEIDGCFIDSHELGRCYGTSMALLCLADIESELTQ